MLFVIRMLCHPFFPEKLEKTPMFTCGLRSSVCIINHCFRSGSLEEELETEIPV